MSAKRWTVVGLAVIALCVLGLAVAAHLAYVVVGLMILAALFATYLAGRKDSRQDDG